MVHLHEVIPDVLVAFVIFTRLFITAGELTNKEHRTYGALVPKNELSCYQCDSMEEADRCTNLQVGNKSALLKKCHGDKRICIVKQYSYTTSTENSPSEPKMWSLRRNCTSRCEAGCIVIGERTKLYACTACCSSNGCNDGNGSANKVHSSSAALLIPLSYFLVSLSSR